MKKLFRTFLVSTSLATAAIGGAYAVETDLANDGVRAAPVLNIAPGKATLAHKFAALPYKAFNADGVDKKKIELYQSLITDLQTDGYTVSTIKGVTGHTILVDWFERESTIGIFAQKGDKVVISFRGTQTLSDWITNVHAFNGWGQKSRFRGEVKGGVHAGYNKTYKSFEEQVMTKLAEASQKNMIKEIEVIGHSLGGGLAQLTSPLVADFAKKNGIDADVHLAIMNAPRVGTHNFVEKLEGKIGAGNILNAVVDYDFVSKIVLGILGFQSVGHKINVPLTGRVAENPTLLEKVSDFFFAVHPLNNHPLDAVDTKLLEDGIVKHNANPIKIDGIRDTLAKNPVGSVVFKAARFVKSNVLNPVADFIKTSVESVKSAVVSDNKEGFRAQLRNSVNNAVTAVKDVVPVLAEKAKQTFVSGFQKARSSVAGWFGY